MDANLKETPAADGTSAHLNQVYLMGSVITGVAYNGTVEVTSGQPIQGDPTPSTVDGGWQINFTCGRQSNAGVAQDFMTDCGGSSSNVFGLDTNFDSTPDNLNFFFGVNITFSGQASPVTLYLGQGHVWLTGANNWWIGGTNLNNSDGSVTISLPGGGQVNVSGGDDDHTFQFS